MKKSDYLKNSYLSQITIPAFDLSGIANIQYDLSSRVLASCKEQMEALTSVIDQLSSVTLPDMHYPADTIRDTFSSLSLLAENQVAEMRSILTEFPLPAFTEVCFHIPNDLSESLASHLSEIATQFSEPLSDNVDDGENLSTSVAKAASSVKSGHLSLDDIYKIISILIAIFTTLHSILPNNQLSAIISAIQETKAIEQRMVELQEEQIDIQLRQLEAEQKQVELLEQMKDDISAGE